MRARIQRVNLMRIHADPHQALPSHLKLNYNSAWKRFRTRRKIFFVYFLDGLECAGHSFAYVAYFIFFEISGFEPRWKSWLPVSGLYIYSFFVQFLFYSTRLLEGQINADPCGSGSKTLKNKWLKL
jgi:hypothetical protein